jgi:response regulator RpfG family c-di-GMP phosphodiesterase
MNSEKPVILCVDDEEANLRLLENMLAPKGYEVQTAIDGDAALAKIGTAKIDLILLDVMMPGLNGYEVCRKIKSSEELRSIPVIMLTSLRSKSDRIKGIESGAEDFITKPFNLEEVLARISNLLKVKKLNDELSAAYGGITSLITAGEGIIGTVGSSNFSLMPMLDVIVERIVGKPGETYHKPQTILVRILDEKDRRRWYRFDSVSGKIQRRRIVLGVDFTMAETGGLKMFHGNKPAAEKLFPSLTEELRAFKIPVENLVCYLSEEVAIMALNYGRDVTRYDAAVLESLVVQTLFMRSLSMRIKETEESFEYTVHALARASEANDEDTGNHIYRVGEYCALPAKKVGLDDSFIKDIRLQATLHDIGKIHIHPDILKKPGPLTPEEWVAIKQHPLFAANIIGNHRRLEQARVIAMTHHEKWDGSGYPNGLRDEGIHIGGRITAIADCYDALRNRRHYKPGFDHETTVRIITEGDGRTRPEHFDPDLLKVFRETAPPPFTSS